MPQTSDKANGHVVLVVDDAIDTLRLLCDALAMEGYSVLVARDAAEARARFEMAVPDAVLLDAVMPGTDGFMLCREIKSTPPWAHVPIVFMTGLSGTDEVVRGFESGGVDYVVKPLRIPEVLARVATHVRNARATRWAREAVDVAGMGVVMLDVHGRVAWRSPRATEWLSQAFDAEEGDAATAAWLSSVEPGKEAERLLADGSRLVAQHMGQGWFAETMLLLGHTPSGSAPAARVLQQALTPRESEVLVWLAKGKTNRDIADILGMSPRTVNKHLEHIFEKLGVETRTAAVAIAGQLQAQL